jgi:hypothetical protein
MFIFNFFLTGVRHNFSYVYFLITNLGGISRKPTSLNENQGFF